MTREVTNLVKFNDKDNEFLSISKCMCGKEFNSWEFSISIYPESIHPCPNCGREMYFKSYINIKVYEFVDENKLEGEIK